MIWKPDRYTWPELQTSLVIRSLWCCVFRPAFGCCTHPKAGWNTFFQPFSSITLWILPKWRFPLLFPLPRERRTPSLLLGVLPYQPFWVLLRKSDHLILMLEIPLLFQFNYVSVLLLIIFVKMLQGWVEDWLTIQWAC